MAIGNRSSEEVYLAALERVLASRFSIYDYKIGAYQECATCIEKDDDEWIVYDAERGVHLREERSELLPEACLMFLKKMTLDTQEILSMNEELLMHVLIEKKMVSPYEPIYKQDKKFQPNRKVLGIPIIDLTGQEIDGLRITEFVDERVRTVASFKGNTNPTFNENVAQVDTHVIEVGDDKPRVVKVAKVKAAKVRTAEVKTTKGKAVEGKTKKGKAAETAKATRRQAVVAKRK